MSQLLTSIDKLMEFVSNLNEEQKLLLVNGYIHNIEKEEKMEIMQDIIDICCIFYGYQNDYWNDILLDKDIFNIDKNDNTLTRHKPWSLYIARDTMVIGKYQISNKTNKKQWQLQILPYRTTSSYFFIGISTKNGKEYYSLYAQDGTLACHNDIDHDDDDDNNHQKKDKYCDKLQVGDIIKMLYKKKTNERYGALNFLINDKDFGIAFDRIDFSNKQIYHLRVNMVMPCSLRLLN